MMSTRQVVIERNEKEACFHEAGHVVAAWLLQSELVGAYIAPGVGGRVGVTGKEYVIDAIRHTLAGVAVYCLRQKIPLRVDEDNFRKLGALEDYHKAFELMQRLMRNFPGAPSDTDELLTRVLRDVVAHLAHHRREIDAIAMALLERKTLDAAEIENILSDYRA